MSLPVAIVSNDERRGNKLKELLQANGIQALVYTTSHEDILPQIEEHPAAVIVDLDGGGEREHRVIQELIDQDAIPVLFNDGTCLEGHAPALEREVGGHIADKVATVSDWGLAGASPALDGPDADGGGAAAGMLEAVKTEAPHLWVLGASLGGPEAVKRFISAVPADLPLAFLLVQHIGAEHIVLLQEQLRRATAWHVAVAHAGQLPQAGQLIIAPMDGNLGLDAQGRIELSSAVAGEPPCSIDIAMAAVANRYGHRAGAIVFSGIGNDGVVGAREILDHGGTLWTQSAASCIMNSMPGHVRNACPVELDGAPEELAQALVRLMRPGRPRWRADHDMPPASGMRAG